MGRKIERLECEVCREVCPRFTINQRRCRHCSRHHSRDWVELRNELSYGESLARLRMIHERQCGDSVVGFMADNKNKVSRSE